MRYLFVAVALLLPVMVEAKEVVIPYNDFLTMLSTVEHKDKLKNKAMAENGVLLQLKDEQGTIIKVQAEQIKACEEIVKSQDQLHATRDQIDQAVQRELLGMAEQLEQAKSRTKWLTSGGFAAGAIVTYIIMTVMN